MKSPTNYGPCAVEGCGQTARARGFCAGHYQRFQRFGDPRADVPLRRRGASVARKPGERKCSIDGCDAKSSSRGWCNTHYARWWKHGDPLAVTKRWARGVPCRVDGCDLSSLSLGYCKSHYSRLWKTGQVKPQEPIRTVAPPGSGCVGKDGYRRFWVDGKGVMEHRTVMEASLGRPLEPGETVHHRNGDRLDNRLENLELWVSRHAGGQRVSERVADAVAVLRRYAPDLLAASGGSFADAAGYSAHMNGHGEGLHGT
jgi:HNH endonuclease